MYLFLHIYIYKTTQIYKSGWQVAPLPSLDEGKLGAEGDLAAQLPERDGAQAVEDEQDDEQEEDGARVQHDALRAVELHGAKTFGSELKQRAFVAQRPVFLNLRRHQLCA
jgi:hypothetical protein